MINLQEISDGTNIEELKIVQEKLEKQYIGIKKLVSVEQYEQYIIMGLNQHLNKYKDLDKFFGIILTLSQPRDGVAKRRSEARTKYLADPQMAIRTGVVWEIRDNMVTKLEKGSVVQKQIKDVPKSAMYIPDQKVYIVPLDDRENWPNGKKNFNYLKPIPSEQYFTNCEGFIHTDSGWKPFKMTFNCGEHLENFPIGQMIKFYGKIKNDHGNYCILSYNNKYTKFELTGDAVPDDLSAHILNFYDILAISDIPDYFENRDDPFENISILGQIYKIWAKDPTDDKPYPWSTIIVLDTTGQSKVLLHPSIKLTGLEETSLVKVWGSVSKGKKWDSTTGGSTDEDEYTIFGNGIYVMSMATEEKEPEEWES